MAFDFDLFVIGAGSGGVRAARVAAMGGARVAVAEEYRIGGTCVIRGCVPKKFFVYASEYAQTLKDMAGYGWSAEAKFNWATLRDNVAGDVGRLSQIYETNLRKSNAQIFQERAELADANNVRLASGRTVSAERILIAAGGRPVRPHDVPGQECAIVSDDAFNLPALPKRLVIVGGGYIACEFAHIFHGLGVDVTLVYRGAQILRGFDDDIREHVHNEMVRTGIKIRCSNNVTAIEKQGEAYRCAMLDGDPVETDLVMFAIGRTPNTNGLGLENAGIAIKPNGAIAVNEYSQTNVPSIYAVGDVTDRINLTPVAIREGHAFADTVFHDRPTAFDHADVASAVFTRPSVGVVGLTEAQARSSHHEIDIYKTSFRPMKLVLAGNHQRMLMKLVVCSSDNIVLGVHLAGPDAPEMIQLAAVAVKARLTKAQWDATCAVHPSAAEELVTLREKARDPADAAVEVRHASG